jgi:hypothetical protein
MKAKCNVQYKGLKGIFDIGDVVEIESILSTHREVLNQKKVEYTRLDTNGKEYKGYKWVDDVIREIGSYVDFRIKSKNGQYYNANCLICIIGYKSLSEIFTKTIS